MNKVCVLLNGPIIYDSRVIKIINTISHYCMVDLFYFKPTPNDFHLFENSQVRLFPVKESDTFLNKVLKHSFFFLEYNILFSEAIKENIKYHYIWANDLPTLWPALKLKKKLGSKVIYDSHEIYLETLSQFFPDGLKSFKGKIFKVLLRAMKLLGNGAEKRMVRNIDSFITVSESVKEYFERKYNYKDIEVVLNCPVLRNNQEEKINLKKELNIPERTFLLIYQGTLAQGRHLDEIIEAMKFTESNIFLLIVGDGMLKPFLIEKVNKIGVNKKVFFWEMVPSDQLNKITRGADGGIVLQDIEYNLSKRLGIANKFFEYIHAGIPFIATKAPENKKVVEQFKVGILIQNTVSEIALAINKLAKMEKSIFIQSSYEAKQIYNWGEQEKKIRGIITKLSSHGKI